MSHAITVRDVLIFGLSIGGIVILSAIVLAIFVFFSSARHD